MGSEESANARSTVETGVAEEIRDYWDQDAVTYHRSSMNYPQGSHLQAAWAAALPYHAGLTPGAAVRLVEASPWGQARIERLRDIEWATTEGLGPLDSLLGTHPRWALTAGR